jgi:hypothetical protein
LPEGEVINAVIKEALYRLLLKDRKAKANGHERCIFKITRNKTYAGSNILGLVDSPAALCVGPTAA